MSTIDNKTIIIISLIILLPIVFYFGVNCNKSDKHDKRYRPGKNDKKYSMENKENFDMFKNDENENELNFMQLSNMNSTVPSNLSVLRTRNGVNLIKTMHKLTKLGLINHLSLFKDKPETAKEYVNITYRNPDGSIEIIKEGGPLDPTVLCVTSTCNLIGAGIRIGISSSNIMDPDTTGRGSQRQIFKQDLIQNYANSCNAETGDNTILQEISGSTVQELVSNTSSKLNVSGGFTQQSVTVSGTLDAATGGATNSTSRAQAYSLKLITDVAHLNLLPTFTNNPANLLDAFVQALLGLPVKITDPHIRDNWAPYIAFLDRYGDHMISSITFGASFNIWQSTTSETEDVTEYLKVKACMAAASGDKSTDPHGSACGEYDSSTRSRAERIKSTLIVYVGGGDDQLRTEIVVAYKNKIPLRDGLIDDFLNSATLPGGTKPIKYIFTPIWEFISGVVFPSLVNEIIYGRIKTPTPLSYINSRGQKIVYSAANVTQICANLQAAYVIDKIDCRFLTASNVEYQKFMATNPAGEFTGYKCWAKKEGCNGDGCRMTGNNGCNAYGAGTITKGDEFMKIPGYATQYRSKTQDSPNGQGTTQGINQSCYWSYNGCNCNPSWSGGLQDRDIWTSGQ